MGKNRCGWCLSSDLYITYHDEEWGVPLHDDNKHFEFFLLETMQAGLSWITILKRREEYRSAFAGFDPKKVAKFEQDMVEKLMQNPRIIRNRRKIEAAVINAQKFLDVQKEYESFDKFIWEFTGGQTIQSGLKNLKDIKSTSELSDTVTKELKRRGFKFVGSTTIYAYLQAIGVINDHLVDCFRYKEV